jgi:hypothetical protein
VKTISIIAIVLGGLPLLVYPFVLLADVMSLAGEQSGKRTLLTVVARAFLWTSLAYPVVYLPCLSQARSLFKKMHEEAALGFCVAPLGYLIIVVVLFFAWSNVSKKSQIRWIILIQPIRRFPCGNTSFAVRFFPGR